MKVDISYGSVLKVLGELLIVEGLLLLIPLIMELCGGEGEWFGFVISSSLALTIGVLTRYLFRGVPISIGRREGFMLVSFAWVVFSLIGMIPFMMSRHPLSVSDAFFETISGFTTTGATTIADVESLSHGVLLWRAMTQWVGGLGIILFVLAILPQLNERGGIPMYNAETTGITHDKLHPQIRKTAGSLWLVYLVLTLVLTGALWAGPMNFYDSLCQALTAISTGGFSTRNASIAYWNSDYSSVVLTIFMFLGGANFSLLYGASMGRWKMLVKNDVFRAYFWIVIISYLLLLGCLLVEGRATNISEALVKPMFHVVSTITTTGYTLADFSVWGGFGLLITFLLMIIGSCAGSTSGAIKIDRMVALRRNLINEVKKALYPRRVMVVRVNGQVIYPENMARIMAFITIYMGLILAGSLIVCGFGVSLDDSFFAVISCVGNNGLGYGITGAAGGYHLLPDITKWILSLLMLLGRLELFSILIMFFPIFWRK